MGSVVQECFNCGDSIKNEILYCFNCDINLKNPNRKFLLNSLIIAPILVIFMSSFQRISLNFFSNVSFYIAISVEALISPVLTTIFLYPLVRKSNLDTRKDNLVKLIAFEYVIVLIGEIFGYFLQVWVIQPVFLDPILNMQQNNIGDLLNLSILNGIFLFAGAFQFIAILFLLVHLRELKAKKGISQLNERHKLLKFIVLLGAMGVFPSLFDIIENIFLNTSLRSFTFDIYNFIFISNLFYLLLNGLLIFLAVMYLKIYDIQIALESFEAITFAFLIIYLGNIAGNLANWLINPLRFISLSQFQWDGALYIIILSITTSFTIMSYFLFLIFIKKKFSIEIRS